MTTKSTIKIPVHELFNMVMDRPRTIEGHVQDLVEKLEAGGVRQPMNVAAEFAKLYSQYQVAKIRAEELALAIDPSFEITSS